MRDQPTDGDVKKCRKCGHLMMTLTHGLTSARIAITADGETLSETTYKRAWHCSHCGMIELVSREPT